MASILAYLGSGMTVEEILAHWPELERLEILEALGYAAWAVEERIVPVQEEAAG